MRQDHDAAVARDWRELIPIPVLVVGGAWILATVVGEVIYYLVWKRTSGSFGATVLLMPHWWGLTFLAALIALIEWRCWPLATRRVKTIALIVFLVCVPFKYWTIRNWDRVRGRSGLFSEVTEPCALGRRLALRDVGGGPSITKNEATRDVRGGLPQGHTDFTTTRMRVVALSDAASQKDRRVSVRVRAKLRFSGPPE